MFPEQGFGVCKIVKTEEGASQFGGGGRFAEGHREPLSQALSTPECGGDVLGSAL